MKGCSKQQCLKKYYCECSSCVPTTTLSTTDEDCCYASQGDSCSGNSSEPFHYRRVLGPTADESILKGLKTFMNFSFNKSKESVDSCKTCSCDSDNPHPRRQKSRCSLRRSKRSYCCNSGSSNGNRCCEPNVCSKNCCESYKKCSCEDANQYQCDPRCGELTTNISRLESEYARNLLKTANGRCPKSLTAKNNCSKKAAIENNIKNNLTTTVNRIKRCCNKLKAKANQNKRCCFVK